MKLIKLLAKNIKLALSTILPAGLTKNEWIRGLRWTSKVILGSGAVVSLTLFTLFVLSIRRRFRR
ncbi:MAG: hypothetical protein A2527_02450 [Candidatus Lambdaproteobacteria bacterium RIFOXYD2_FULL_50_16]|uniref:Uncharacterized protein n=1 Tax=Candidatus Lambdaproteobacteria bacterium RIFOXYD2_FULL_50_16 TaxID=1817772 RepID=A0A1F6GDZ8_9PROT|nr:MAG: hypothetical protein A2527_02450 [Candidatus Lambdaproteobacteria bacterium RIFOXYD2_FULL_50_16]